jgi:hypothetical protein
MPFQYSWGIKQIILIKIYEDGATSIFVSGQGRCAMLTVTSSLLFYGFFFFISFFEILDPPLEIVICKDIKENENVLLIVSETYVMYIYDRVLYRVLRTSFQTMNCGVIWCSTGDNLV